MLRVRALTASLVVGLLMTAGAQAAPVTSVPLVSLPGTTSGSVGSQVTGEVLYDRSDLSDPWLRISLTNNATDPDNFISAFVFNIDQDDVTLTERSFPGDTGPWELWANPTANAPFGNFDWGVGLDTAAQEGLNSGGAPTGGIPFNQTGVWEFNVSGLDAETMKAGDLLSKVSSGVGGNPWDAAFAASLRGGESDTVPIIPSPTAASVGLVLLGLLLMRRPSSPVREVA